MTKGQIEIRPLPIKKWHGNTGKASVTRPKTIEALPDETMNYAIALGREKNIDWEENGQKYQISELEHYSKIIGQDLSTQFILGKEHPFYSSKMGRIKLENATMFLNKDNPIDYVKIAILKKSPSVATSLRDFEEGRCPEATHYIVDENYEVEQFKAKKLKKDEVVKSITAMSKEDKGKLLFLITGRLVDNQSEDFIDMHLEKIVEKEIEKVIPFIKMGNDTFTLTATIEKAVRLGLMTKEGLKYKYHGTTIGNSLEEVITYLKDDENNMFKIDLMEKVSNVE
jgi:hypothetical protein